MEHGAVALLQQADTLIDPVGHFAIVAYLKRLQQPFKTVAQRLQLLRVRLRCDGRRHAVERGELIAVHHDRLTKVERGIILRHRNAGKQIDLIQLFIGQAAILAPEDQRHALHPLTLLQQLRFDLLRRSVVAEFSAAARRGGDGEVDIGQRVAEGVEGAQVIEDLATMRSSLKPMVFIARAAAPIFSARAGETRIRGKRMIIPFVFRYRAV